MIGASCERLKHQFYVEYWVLDEFKKKKRHFGHRL